MLKWSYKYAFNPKKETITLSPTLGTYVKAFALPLIMSGGMIAVSSMLFSLLEEKETQPQNEVLSDPEND